MRALPSGTVTFVFTDVEGSTRLLQSLGEAGYADALAEHRRLLREAFARHGGVEVDTQGDAFFFAFPSAEDAVAAAGLGQEALADGPIAVRMGLHTGIARLTDEGYVGADVHLGARIAAAGHGGQVLLSAATRERLGVTLEGDVLLDLGEHRFKDFDEAISIFQLGSQGFPPLRTIANTNLPRPASSFVGRQPEVSDIVRRLRDGARLLTLTGPGGSGKTRLAIEAASELVPAFRAGVFWVGLAPLRDAALVLPTIGQALGAKTPLPEHIADRELLLVVDNLEHVVTIAPDVASLVEACPNLRLLATSRERLRVRGEVELPVRPLADPDAVALFADRSGMEAGGSEDRDVLAIVRALDSLPLAVELAAARASVLSPADILARLASRLDLLRGGRDADPRQQTLRATIEWSYDLLEPAERALFARLAIFRGGWMLDAAETVTDADLDTLQSLVDKSLVGRRSGRFGMLETIREFAAERLSASGWRDELARRHAAWFLAFAEEAERHLGGTPGDWLDRLDADHDNLRAAADQFAAAGEGEPAQRLAGALWKFWNMRGHLAEGRQRAERALALDAGPNGTRVGALHAAAVMALNTGEIATARLRAEEALRRSRDLDDAWAIAYSLLLLGNVATEENDFPTARVRMEDALERFRALGDAHYRLIARDNLAWISDELGDRVRARELYAEGVREARAAGDERVLALALDGLASVLREEGRLAESVPMLRESIAISYRLGDRHLVARTLLGFARLVVSSGRAEDGVRLVARSEALHEEIGVREAWRPGEIEKILETARARLDAPAVAAAWSEGLDLTLDAAIELALDATAPEPGA